jgi:hypothetical protein
MRAYKSALPACQSRSNIWRIEITFRRSIIALALCTIAFIGCGGANKGPATVEVIGTVTLNGSPIEGANVVFCPNDGSDARRLSSQAATDRDGRFRLTTHTGGGKFKSGIVPGKYDVTISKLDTASIKNTMSPPKNLLPAKYADPKTSQLKADVAAGQANDFPFLLKSE